MTKNFVQEGHQISVTAPYAVASGAGVQVGQVFGVAVHAAAIGEPVEMVRHGIYRLVKTTAEAWTAFVTRLYWNDTTKAVTSTVGSNKLIGVAAETKLAADVTGAVLLSPTVA